tara:strand:- start:9676 stop:10587 length:912 start_codon:yes stop_codon:yes gene_type:complete
MELFEEIDASDPTIIDRIRTLDSRAKDTGYKTHDGEPFSLATFIQQNVAEIAELSGYTDQCLVLLWTACSLDLGTADTTVIGATSRSFPDLEPGPNARVLCDFVTELGVTIQTEIPAEERKRELEIFSQLIKYDCRDEHAPGLERLEVFRVEIRGLSFLPQQIFALPYFLQVQSNFKDLVDNKHVFRIARKLVSSTTPSTTDWMDVLAYLESSDDFYPTGSKSPPVLEHFVQGFHNSAPKKQRCLQLFTIYHPEWMQIWTHYGWKCNRLEKEGVEAFMLANPTPFYQETFLNEFFPLFMNYAI